MSFLSSVNELYGWDYMEDCLLLFSASHPRYHTASDWHHLRTVPCACTVHTAAEQATEPIPPSLVWLFVPFPMLLVIVSLESGYTALWVVGHQLLTTEAKNQFERNPCEICGRQSDNGTSLSPAVLVCLSIIISLILHTHSPVIRCWYDRFTSSRGTDGPSQPRPTDLILYIYRHMSHTMITVNMFSPNHTNYMLQYNCTIIRWNTRVLISL